MRPCLPCKNPPPPPPGSHVTMVTDWLKPDQYGGCYIYEDEFLLTTRSNRGVDEIYLNPRCAYSTAAFSSINEAIIYMIAISMTFPDLDRRLHRADKTWYHISHKSRLGTTHFRFGIFTNTMEEFSSRLIQTSRWRDWFKVLRENILEARDKLIAHGIVVKEIIRTKDFIISELVVKGERMGYFFDDRTLNLAVFAKTFVDLAREYKKLRVRPFDDLRKWPDVIRSWFREISEVPRRKLCQRKDEPYIKTLDSGLLSLTLTLKKIEKDTPYTNGSLVLQFCKFSHENSYREDPFQFKFVNNRVHYSNKVNPLFHIDRDTLVFSLKEVVQNECLNAFMNAASLIASIYRKKYQKLIKFMGFEPF